MNNSEKILRYIKRLVTLYVLFLCYIPQVIIKWLMRSADRTERKRILFVHTAGEFFGGGEKVLWTAVHAILKDKPKYKISILMNNKEELSDLLRKIEARYGLKINEHDFYERIKIIDLPDELFIRHSDLIFGTVYIKFMLNVIIYMYCVIVSSSGFSHVIDTEGNPIFVLLAKVFSKASTIVYIHYPYIDMDVLKAAGFLKRLYYQSIVLIYNICINNADKIMANSSWTENKLLELNSSLKLTKIFPPCNIEDFAQYFEKTQKEKLIVSFGQFRPEKRHIDQIEIISALKDRLNSKFNGYKFTMIGSARHEVDQALIQELKRKIHNLGLDDVVSIKNDIGIDDIKHIFAKAKFGIHTMINEHFGIGIVEMLSAGVVVLAHNSAGPRNDIIQRSGQCGYLCDNNTEFVDVLERLIKENTEHSHNELKNISETARKKCIMQFSTPSFEKKFLEICNFG